MERLINENTIKDDVKEIMIRFGSCVASTREEKNITLKQLSQSTGMSIGAISELDSYSKDTVDKEKVKIPSLYTIIALAMVLEIDLSMFNEVVYPVENKESTTKKNETILRDTMKKLNVPHKAITSIMTYINILSNIGDMYDLQHLDNITGADKQLQRKQNELLNTYSRLRRETP